MTDQTDATHAILTDVHDFLQHRLAQIGASDTPHILMMIGPHGMALVRTNVDPETLKAIAAVYPDARNPFAYPELIDEGLEAWTVPEVWVMGGAKPNTHVDVTDQVERKIRALLCHETQHQDPSGVEGRVRGWMGMTAQHFGLPEGRFAEAFQVVDTR